MGGLDDHGAINALAPHRIEDPHAIEIRHHEIEQNEVNPRADLAAQPRHSRLAAFNRQGIMAEAPDLSLEKPPLDGIVIGDEDQCRHGHSSDSVLCIKPGRS